MKTFLDWFVIFPAIIFTYVPIFNYFNIDDTFYSRFFYCFCVYLIHKFIYHKFIYVEDKEE